MIKKILIVLAVKNIFKYNFIGKFFWSWRGMPSEYKEKFI